MCRLVKKYEKQKFNLTYFGTLKGHMKRDKSDIYIKRERRKNDGNFSHSSHRHGTIFIYIRKKSSSKFQQ